MNKLMMGASALLILAGCSEAGPPQATPVFPDAADPTPFTRAYSMTESLDGAVRVYAQEDGDQTQLKLVRRQGRGWSEPELLDLPHRKTLTGPRFSFEDGALYYASDAPMPARPGRTDLNIWKVDYKDGTFGEPEPLEVGTINTGANETMAAVASDGTMLLVTNHSRAGGGGYDLMQAHQNTEGQWQLTVMPDGINDLRTDDHVAIAPNGQWAIFYSHRMPKEGSADLWRMARGADGEWQLPVNLGPVVNTEAIEFGAGLSGDGSTFFFSRDGRLMKLPVSALDRLEP